MKNLKNLYLFLKEKIDSGKTNYAIPKRWMPDDYEGIVKIRGRKFVVNPYEYFSRVIEKIMKNADENIDYSKPLSLVTGEKSSEWIKKAIVYSAHVRMTTAYQHNADAPFFMPVDDLGFKESGTFLKMIALLPYLKQYNVDAIYLLPITQSSNKFKKGEVGSPYAVKSFHHVEKDYHDPILEKFNADEEFAAFVEAAHMYGMRVILDFIPRTAARDNDLILEHPDWFYWIDIKELSSYGPPKIEGLDFEQPSAENLPVLYSNEEVKRHLKKFRWAPNITDPQKWENFVKKNKNNPDFLEEIVREFKVITVPGFSDWINDPQPTWDDVTFLRLFMSHPEESEKYLENPQEQPPYVLYDVVKSSKFPGKEINSGLWEMISNIMPYFQKNFGIDGARLDMGHALPKELEHQIISNAKNYDPSFAIIAEELSMDNHIKAKNSGYDAILGNTWWAEPRHKESWFIKTTRDIMPALSVPSFATAETPDSPRAVTRDGGELFSKLSAVVNTFMPNGITFINSGSEIFEKQPMNLGLDFEKPEEERFKYLEPTDQFYGKLAFFDYYALHWDTDRHMVRLLVALGKIKKEHADLIANISNFRYTDHMDKVFSIFYWDGNKGLLIPVNLNFDKSVNFAYDLGYHTWRGHHKISLLLENYRRCEFKWDEGAWLNITLNPGEAKIYLVE
ncbi:glycosidase [Marinitoga piezophila KA3]|uniref:Glycosidase n=1 Tax=Marinitoga piezophila (strain DSM 14283 / JCM 11233 / KA3) TaxID=443254 RepID=H2J6L8_MARPK|nr:MULTISPECIES: alpha-amylase family glycosyl hydrolase [Marinitoga]AEX85203.1 glycosidase [Marinitoga piezophila KA3]APT75694.1 maltodextrin glycosyltransferase [Marinitoga sp. 1137]